MHTRPYGANKNSQKQKKSFDPKKEEHCIPMKTIYSHMIEVEVENII